MDEVEAKRCAFVILVLIRHVMSLPYIGPREGATHSGG